MSEPQPKDGVICTAEDFELSQTNTSIHCLTRGQSIGLTLPVETGLLSLLAVLVVFVLIIRNIRRYRRKFSDREWSLFQEPSDVFMITLFTFDIVQAIGAIMDLKWIIDGKVFIGSFCSAQGAVQQIGETGVAMTTLAIAIQTFIAVWWSRGLHTVWIAWAVVGAICLYVGLFVIAGIATHSDKSTLYMSPTPYWCWIGKGYLTNRILGEYIWLWLTLFFSIAAYVPLFFWAHGRMVPGGNHWYSWSWQKQSPKDKVRGDRLAKRRSLDMIAYPLAYCLVVLPQCVIRWVEFSKEAHGSTVPSAATILGVTLFGLSGIVNALLFLSTRPERLLFAKEPPMPVTEGIALHNREATEATLKSGNELEQSDNLDLDVLLSGSTGAWNPNPKARPNSATETTGGTIGNQV